MNPWDMIPVLLLLLFSVALSVGAGFVVLIIRRGRRPRQAPPAASVCAAHSVGRASFARRPPCWLAVKSRNLLAVQCALGLNNPKPCSCLEGMAGEEKLFIAPPVKGWILVVGSGLPDPSDDIDACFRFVLDASRRLGNVQFFSASRILLHHAWVQADRGRVVRAYAWAGRTLWKQGRRTAAEKELDVRCFDYTDSPEHNFFGQLDVIAANVEKVPLVAARWSLDPARIEERFLETERGVAGELSRRY